VTSPQKAPYFELRRSQIQGRGAFATRRIRAGTRIIEYTGELISQDEANRRYDDDSMSRHHTFLFSVDDDRVIDGAAGGNDSRYINHSCAPNCEAVNEDGRIFIEALRTIEPGEELAYDYAYARTPENDNPEGEALYACRCGAPTCRGTILEPARKRRARKAAKKGAPKRGAAKRGATTRGAAKRGTTAAKRGSATESRADRRGRGGATRGATQRRTAAGRR
jgi:hypothetical protein